MGKLTDARAARFDHNSFAIVAGCDEMTESENTDDLRL